MNYYKLSNDDLQPVVFWASNSQLKSQLNSAYMKFKNRYESSRAVLYVHHPVHGWQQVWDDRGRYPIINNPLTLDQQALILAVIHTLAQADLFPTAKQKMEKIEKGLRDERQQNAEIRRNAFHLVKK